MYHLLLVGLALLVPAQAGIPDYLSAVSYDLSFTFSPSINMETFTGEANIVLRTSNTTGPNINALVLHGYDLSMKEISVVYPSTRKIHVPSSSVVFDKNEQTVTLPLPEALAPSADYSLRILYTGNINDDTGVVRTKYNDGNYLVTVLYPANARRMYPCIDMPNMRATYKVTFNVNYNGEAPTVISGLRKIDDSKTDSKKKILVITYDSNNMPLPPYSIAFTIGNYKRVITGLDLMAPTTTNEALICKNAVNALKTKTIENLKRAANLNSLNLVIVPGLPVKSVSGYGITTISLDLGTELDASSTPALRYQGTAILSALIKSIFGSVISPAAWNDIWISESIPLYISNAALTEIPRWEDWKNMGAIDAQQAALESTWSEDSWPVKPDKFASISDLLKFISGPAIYKGASIVGMMESLSVNSPAMSAFITLVKDMNGYAVSTDALLDKYEVYNELNQTLPDKMSLKNVINPWIKQTGYPAVSISRKASNIVASQSRFGPNQKTQSSWIVPIYYSENINSTTTYMKWLNSAPNTDVVLATNMKQEDLVTVNFKGSGMYRVIYSEEDLALLKNKLEKNVNYVTPEVRTTLISDSLAFARVGGLRYSTVLKMMTYLTQERSLGPWTAASEGLRDMWLLLYFTDLKTQFENYSTALLRYSYIDPSIGGLGLKDSSLMNGQLRRLIVSQLCDYNDLNCREDALEAYNNYIVKNEESKIVATDMVPVVYCNGLRHLQNAEQIKDYLSKKYVSSATQDVKRNVFSYLACAKENNTLRSLLNAVLLDGAPVVRDIWPEDIVMAFEEVAHRPEQILALLDFFVNNYGNLNTRLKDEHKAQMVQIIGQVGSTNDHLKMLGMLKYGDSSLLKDAVTKALASIQTRQNFLKTNYDEIKRGLYGQTPIPTTPTPTPGPSTKPTSGTTTTKKPNGAAGLTGTACLILTAVFILFKSH